MDISRMRPQPEEWVARLPPAIRQEGPEKDRAAWEAYGQKREAFRNARACNCATLLVLEGAWVRALRGRDVAEQERIEAFIRAAWVSRGVTDLHPFGDVIAWWHRRRTWHAERECQALRLPTPPPDPADYIGEPGRCRWCILDRGEAPRGENEPAAAQRAPSPEDE